MDKNQLTTRQNLERLPSLPQVLLKILDAVNHDTADFHSLAEIIRQDSAIAARLISIANSSFYRRHNLCDSVDRALMTLGLETVKTLVITAAVKQYFGHFNAQQHRFLRRFWLRSLVAAHCAQVLANLTRYNSPSEAYLCGLLIDVGQLCLLGGDTGGYQALLDAHGDDDRQLIGAEQQLLQTSHDEIGGLLIDSWQLDSFMADAVRFHHQPAAQLQHSHHLVKIINLASAMSKRPTPDDHALRTAGQLFGLNEELVIELQQRIGSDVQRVAENMGIALDDANATQSDQQAHRALGEKLGEISQLNALRQQFSATGNTADPQHTLQQNLQRSLYLALGIERHLVFIHNAATNTLEARTGQSDSADFIIDSAASDSLVSRCFNRQISCSSVDDNTLISLGDRQLLGYCRQPHLLCLPLNAGAEHGVLVTGATAELLQQQQAKSAYWQTLLNSLAAQLLGQSANKSAVENVTEQQTEQRIREAVHEVSNPLSIINNYLEMLRIKLGNSSDTERDFTILKEEIERIGQILLRLREPAQAQTTETTDINQTLKDLAQIFNQSLCLTRGITLTLSLDSALQPLPLNKPALKQIITNLLKNAIEALGSGGQIRISSQSRANINGRHYVAITLEDNGPGIAPAVMEKLFQPVTTTKDASHAGLGLSVVKKLMDDMQAQIVCSSDSKGSQFKLLFPIS